MTTSAVLVRHACDPHSGGLTWFGQHAIHDARVLQALTDHALAINRHAPIDELGLVWSADLADGGYALARSFSGRDPGDRRPFTQHDILVFAQSPTPQNPAPHIDWAIITDQAPGPIRLENAHAATSCPRIHFRARQTRRPAAYGVLTGVLVLIALALALLAGYLATIIADMDDQLYQAEDTINAMTAEQDAAHIAIKDFRQEHERLAAALRQETRDNADLSEIVAIREREAIAQQQRANDAIEQNRRLHGQITALQREQDALREDADQALRIQIHGLEQHHQQLSLALERQIAVLHHLRRAIDEELQTIDNTRPGTDTAGTQAEDDGR